LDLWETPAETNVGWETIAETATSGWGTPAETATIGWEKPAETATSGWETPAETNINWETPATISMHHIIHFFKHSLYQKTRVTSKITCM
jgi:hypothetical protein